MGVDASTSRVFFWTSALIALLSMISAINWSEMNWNHEILATIMVAASDMRETRYVADVPARLTPKNHPNATKTVNKSR